MIKLLTLKDFAPYLDPVLFELKKINYIYGGNGVGKSSIARFLMSPTSYPTSSIIHEDEVDVLVYNKEYVKKNFHQNIPSIFTLGEDQIQKKQIIIEKQIDIQYQKDQINKKNETIQKIKKEIEAEKERSKNLVWEKGLKPLEQDFKKCFKGLLGSMQVFFDEIIRKNPTENNYDIFNLKSSYKIFFGEETQELLLINSYNYSDIEELENTLFMEYSVVSSHNSQMGQFFNDLKNMDWVKKGIYYLNYTNERCPFCGSTISEDVVRDIEKVFDESYAKSIDTINKSIAIHLGIYSKIREVYNKINNNEFYENLKKDLDVLFLKFESVSNANELLFKRKQDYPSEIIKVHNVKDVCEEIISKITEINCLINSFNKNLKEKKTESEKLIEIVRDLCRQAVKLDVRSYNNFILDKRKALEGVQKSIIICQDKINQMNQEIDSINNAILRSDATLHSINRLLLSFGFDGFSLDHGVEQGTYKVIRSCGTDAKDTLSEGEYNFLTFLYFYHNLDASKEASGYKPKVIVIDDPISSLDSNVLFIVSRLTKNIIDRCRNEDDPLIDQFIVLTHNVYFYKEICFFGGRDNKNNGLVRFFILSKQRGQSQIRDYDKCPIRTSYQLLWQDLKKSTNDNNAVSVFNNMRRILECYYNILGDMDYENLVNIFEPSEQIAFRSLISWINDGSHYTYDELFIDIGNSNIELYMKVFKDIFIETDQIAHFNMMWDQV